MHDDSAPDPSVYGEASPFRPAEPEPLLTRAVPVSGQLPRYRVPSARRDLLAGVTVAALALPSAMAYAEVAGLSPVNGLYALLLPTVAYALLGSSRQLIVGPEGSISTLVGVGGPAARGGRARRGRAGGDAGAAGRGVFRARLGVAAGLARRLLLAPGAGRLHPRRRGRADHRPAREAARSVDRCARAVGAAVGGGARARQRQRTDVRARRDRRSPRCSALRFLLPRLPAALLVVAAAIGVSWALDLQAHGVAVVGEIPAGLPSLRGAEPRVGGRARSWYRRPSASSWSPSRMRS